MRIFYTYRAIVLRHVACGWPTRAGQGKPPHAGRRGGYIHHIARNTKRRGFYFQCEASGVTRIIPAKLDEREMRRAA